LLIARSPAAVARFFGISKATALLQAKRKIRGTFSLPTVQAGNQNSTPLDASASHRWTFVRPRPSQKQRNVTAGFVPVESVNISSGRFVCCEKRTIGARRRSTSLINAGADLLQSVNASGAHSSTWNRRLICRFMCRFSSTGTLDGICPSFAGHRTLSHIGEGARERMARGRTIARVIGLEAEYPALAAAAGGATVPHNDGAEAGLRACPKRQRRTAMEYFAGLDVGMEATAIWVIDREGKVMLETSVTTDPDAIFEAFKPYVARLRRVGHEAGSLSPWLQVERACFGIQGPSPIA